ncbi:MAG: type VI secretion system contractile sheath large subunit, partial [Proteobacteria bacterium]|nr:type VI secretion system contractile sheath large subunit [Pseudomonadota bacterium]
MSSDIEKQSRAADAAVSEGGSLIEQIMAETRLKPTDEGYETAKRGVGAFISELLAPNRAGEKVEQKLVDAMIAEIDKKLSGQMDEILHNEKFQKLESAWRGLKMVVDRTDFRENVKLEVLNVSKEQLLEDFEDAPDVTKSGLYKHMYAAEYGQFGGQPYGDDGSEATFGEEPGVQALSWMREQIDKGYSPENVNADADYV